MYVYVCICMYVWRGRGPLILYGAVAMPPPRHDTDNALASCCINITFHDITKHDISPPYPQKDISLPYQRHDISLPYPHHDPSGAAPDGAFRFPASAGCRARVGGWVGGLGSGSPNGAPSHRQCRPRRGCFGAAFGLTTSLGLFRGGFRPVGAVSAPSRLSASRRVCRETASTPCCRCFRSRTLPSVLSRSKRIQRI